jgi:hypothetical protein
MFPILSWFLEALPWMKIMNQNSVTICFTHKSYTSQSSYIFYLTTLNDLYFCSSQYYNKYQAYFLSKMMLQVSAVDCVWNVMAHAQTPDCIFWWNRRVHLNRWGRQISRLLAAEVCASAVIMLDTPCSEEVWRVLATHSIRQFLLHFPSRGSTCAITFQLDSSTSCRI